MARSTLPWAELRRLKAEVGTATVDMAVQLRTKETGALSAVYGGRWHRRLERHLTHAEIDESGTPLDVHTIDVGEQQLPFVIDFDTPLILVKAKRRGAKSEHNAIKVLVHVCAFPGIIGEFISPTFPKFKLMWKKVLKHCPARWLQRKREKPDWELYFANGSFVLGLSAHNPESLIGEGVHFIAYDEYQSITEEARGQAFPALSDGGAYWQEWGTGTPRMGEFKARFEAIRDDPDGKIYTFTSNPFLDMSKLDEKARSVMSEQRYRREMRAEFVADEGTLYHSFDRTLHGRSWARHGDFCTDITSTFIRDKLSVRNCQFVHGVDYGIGHQYATTYKVVRWHDSGLPGLFAVDTTYMPLAADAERLAAELTAKGQGPKRGLYGGDGEQRAAIFDDIWGGSGFSAAIRWRESGFDYRAPGDHQNPARIDRVESVLHLMLSASGVTRYAVNTDNNCCAELIKSFENQEQKFGKPVKDGWCDNRTDSAGYPCYYLFRAEVDAFAEALDDAA